MKLTLIILVVAVSLFQAADAYYYGGFGYYPFYSYGYSYPYYGLWYGKRDVATMIPVTAVREKTECSYNKDTQMLMCHDETTKSECKAEFNIKKDFILYAIALTENESKFSLIPRKLDNTGWSKDTFFLYRADKFQGEGMVVKDAECFGQLVGLLKKSSRHEKIFIESKATTDATVIADLMVFEKVKREMTEGKTKRFWGYGLGWGGYGGYGLGWGGWWGKRDTTESMSIEEEVTKLKSELKEFSEVSDENTDKFAREIKEIKREIKMLKMDQEDYEPFVHDSKRSMRMWSRKSQVY